jgi:hypothetical protein
MKNVLHVVAVAAVVLLASSIDFLTALIFSNPISAFFGGVIMFLFLAFMAAVFMWTAKRFLNSLERNED